MKVTIAGGGSVGRFIAEQARGGQSRRNDHRQRSRRRGAPRSGRRPEGRGVGGAARARSLTSAVPAPTLQTWSPRHRRRRGQPRHLSSPNRSSACRSCASEQPEERVDVQRHVGCRRRRIHAAPTHRPGPGGGHGGLVRASAVVRGRQSEVRRRSPRRFRGRGRQGDRGASRNATPPSSPSSATTTSSCARRHDPARETRSWCSSLTRSPRCARS